MHAVKRLCNRMELITSSQNPQYKLALKLSESKRERSKNGLALLDGTHLVSAWLDAGHTLKTLMVSSQGLHKPEVQALLDRTDSRCLHLSDELFQSLSDLPSATGLLAIVEIPASPPPIDHGFCLLLDGVQDPGNVGAILRTAYAAGVQQVWLSAACADIWSPKVLRAGMGAQVVLPCIENANLVDLAQQFNGRVLATLLDPAAIDLYAADLQGDLALIVGSEGQGISASLAAIANCKVLIPMQSGIESLNVGHAAAICLFEALRQRRV